MTTRRSLVLVIAIVLLTVSQAANLHPVAADQVGTSWGLSKTYQNNWHPDCQWYDVQHDSGGPYGCYRGVWSDTDAYSSSAPVSVYEYAQRQTWGYCCGQQVVSVYYSYFGAYPSSVSGTNYVTTNHYYAGDYSGSWPVNVIGYAYHYNAPGAGGAYVYTESMWGSEYTN